MSRYDRPPASLRSLRDRLTQASQREGIAFGRLQQHVGMVVIAQFMRDLQNDDGDPLLLVKGGTSLELRQGISGSRASKDLDAVTRHDIDVAHQQLAERARLGWEGFTATLTQPETINVPGLIIKPRRFTAKLAFGNRPFVSIPIEVSPSEAGNTEAVGWTHSTALELVGLPTADPVACMTVDWQIAQKLHAVTAILNEGRVNDRAHDLVDLQILEALVDDTAFASTLDACVQVFTARAQQSWPPKVTVYEHWDVIYHRAASSVPTLDLAPTAADAADRVRDLIERINRCSSG